MRRKGIAVAVIVVAMVGAVVLEGIFISTYIADTDVIRRSGKELDVIETIDSMEFLKTSMGKASEYSIHRASYDTLSIGGYNLIQEYTESSECEVYWRKYENNYIPSDDTIEHNFKQSILDIFECYVNGYSESYSKLGMSIEHPEYSDCGDVVIDYGEFYDLTIVDDCNTGLRISNGDNIIVFEENADFENQLELEYFELFSVGKTMFGDNRPLYTAVQNAVSGLNCKSLSYTGDQCVDAGDLLEMKCGNWEESIKDSIESELGEMISGDAQISVSFNSWDLNYDSNGCSCEDIKDDSGCGGLSLDSICPGECLLGGASECAAYCGYGNAYSCTSEGGCTCCCTCPSANDEPPEEDSEDSCVKTVKKTECSFSFEADVDVTIIVTGDKSYPIYDSITGKTEQTKMSLKFRIIDGNSGNLNPEETACDFSGYC